MKFSPTRTDSKIAILSPDIPDIERTGPVPGPLATNLWEFHSIHNAAFPGLHCTKKLQFANSKPSTYRLVNQLITLMGEMNQNIVPGQQKVQEHGSGALRKWQIKLRKWCKLKKKKKKKKKERKLGKKKDKWEMRKNNEKKKNRKRERKGKTTRTKYFWKLPSNY